MIGKADLGNLRRLWPIVRGQKWALVGIISLTLVGTVEGLLWPLVTRFVIDDCILAGRLRYLLWACAFTLGLLAVGQALSFASGYLSSLFTSRFMFQLRRRLFSKLQELDVGYFVKRSKGDLLSRLNADVGSVQTLASTPAVSILSNVGTVVGTVGVAFVLDWRITLAAMAATPFYLIVSVKSRQVFRSLGSKSRSQAGLLMSFFEEALSSVRLTKGLAREQEQLRRYDEVGNGVVSLALKTVVASGKTGFLLRMLGALGPLVVIGWGGFNVMQGAMTIGTLVALQTYVMRLLSPLSSLITMNLTLQEPLAALERVCEILDAKPAVSEKEDAVAPRDGNGEIELRDVRFGYEPGKRVLDGLSVRIPPHKVFVLHGPNGSGKSTLANLMLRFYDPDEGRILLDGVDLRDLKTSYLREAVRIFHQEPYLFNTSIRENLLFAKPDATEVELLEALSMVGLRDFVQSLPERLDTSVGSLGDRLSGGEKQRIALARDLLLPSKVLILDEPFALVDEASREAIAALLHRLRRERTVVLISHIMPRGLASDGSLDMTRVNLAASQS